ncbi:MAG: hypothetical protein ABIZ70_11655 [Gemmatimonadales bacterium]
MSIFRRSELAISIRRALAGVATVAQLLLLIMPLVDRNENGGAPLSIQALVSGSITSIGAAVPTSATHHDATTCPACIAQTLFAQVAFGVRLPTSIVSERAPADVRPLLLPHHDPPSSHQSRAPPAVS